MKYLAFRFLIFVLLVCYLPSVLMAFPAYFVVFDFIIDVVIFEYIFGLRKFPYGPEVFCIKLDNNMMIHAITTKIESMKEIKRHFFKNGQGLKEYRSIIV